VVTPEASRALYALLVGAVGLERLFELWLTRRNLERARQRGGVEAGRGHYPAMVLLHALFLAACPTEVLLLERPFRPALAAAMLLLLAGAMTLRYWAIATLGERWTTRVVVVPGEAAVTGGPYRRVRHPNYLAVVVEGVALPLVHGAWLTAALFTLANALMLAVRIRAEEAVLRRHADYAERLGDRGRFLPRRRRGAAAR
jgi:methyltransferase